MMAVILAAGKGTRLQPTYACSSKCLIPINGVTMLGRKVRLLAQSKNVEKIIIVIREEQTEIPKYIGNMYNNKQVTYVYQEKDKHGLVGALYSVKEISDLRSTEVLVNLGDEYYEKLDYDNLWEKFKENDLAISPVVIKTDKVDQIRANYTVDFKDDLRISDIVEKPEKVFNEYIGCGTVLISSQILNQFSADCGNQYDGKEMVDWMKFAIRNQLKCCAYKAYGEYVNLNKISDLERIYQNVSNSSRMLCDSVYIREYAPKEETNKGILFGRPNSFSRVYVLDQDKKILGYEQTGDLWLWKREFASPEIEQHHVKERDIICPSEYMIHLGTRGYVKANGLYYGEEMNEFISENRVFV